MSRFVLSLVSLSSVIAAVSSEAINWTTPRLDLPISVQQAWNIYGPYFPLNDYVPPPSGCSVVQVNLLERHGARYPTSSEGKAIKDSVKKMEGLSKYTNSSLDFLKDYSYSLSTDDLVPFGAAESYDSGQLHYDRYAYLVDEDNIPFVRSDSKSRVVESALNWTAGFAYASGQEYVPILNVILQESGNDTLDDNMCPNAGDSDDETADWIAVFAPSIASRLNEWAPGADLDATDATNIISLCAFESVATSEASPFCNFFDQDEFNAYEYYGDLTKYYTTGYGQTLGPVQGVGWVNELLARLTDTPVQDDTQTNHTLDSDPLTFPLGLTFYADFSHDDEMVAIFSAMGLFAQSEALNTTMPDPQRTWIAYKMVPFASRMAVEKLSCDTSGESEYYVRIVVNEAVQPLDFCEGAQSNGLCGLEEFVQSQTFATSDGAGLWPECND